MVSKVAEDEKSVDFYYVDVDQSPELAEKFSIRSIPTLVKIVGGQETNRHTGFIPEAQVKEFAHS